MWLDRARRLSGTAAVHPDTRWLRYDTWTRWLLQRWTLARVRAALAGGRARCAVDLGCGFGDWTALFAELAGEIHACDLAPSLAAAERRRVAWHPAARIEVADVRAFALPRALDFAYVGAVLMYLDDADAADVLARVRDGAAPGALVVIRDFCAFNSGRHADRGSVVYRRPSEVIALAARAGLALVDRALPRPASTAR